MIAPTLTESWSVSLKARHRIPTKEFCNQSGQSATTLWRKSKTDKTFPKAVYILNKKLYYQDEVTAWIEAQERTEPTHNNLLPKGAA